VRRPSGLAPDFQHEQVRTPRASSLSTDLFDGQLGGLDPVRAWRIDTVRCTLGGGASVVLATHGPEPGRRDQEGVGRLRGPEHRDCTPRLFRAAREGRSPDAHADSCTSRITIQGLGRSREVESGADHESVELCHHGEAQAYVTTGKYLGAKSTAVVTRMGDGKVGDQAVAPVHEPEGRVLSRGCGPVHQEVPHSEASGRAGGPASVCA
jgi:hypothetical protein